jgi:hypothetical protein
MPQPPTAKEFLQDFLRAFSECFPRASQGREDAWENWTALMTGKQSKNGGYWLPNERPQHKCVLPMTARKLGLKWQLEYLNLDLVFFPKGEPWGNFVAVEHENVIGRFDEELEKLMCVSMPLKVGITSGNEKQTGNLEKKIRKFFKSWHPSIRQADKSEYLFLVRCKDREQYSWRYVSFTGSDGTRMKAFENTGRTFDFGR